MISFTGFPVAGSIYGFVSLGTAGSVSLVILSFSRLLFLTWSFFVSFGGDEGAVDVFFLYDCLSKSWRVFICSLFMLSESFVASTRTGPD